jgi:hypothetical protein
MAVIYDGGAVAADYKAPRLVVAAAPRGGGEEWLVRERDGGTGELGG